MIKIKTDKCYFFQVNASNFDDLHVFPGISRFMSFSELYEGLCDILGTNTPQITFKTLITEDDFINLQESNKIDDDFIFDNKKIQPIREHPTNRLTQIDENTITAGQIAEILTSIRIPQREQTQPFPTASEIINSNTREGNPPQSTPDQW